MPVTKAKFWMWPPEHGQRPEVEPVGGGLQLCGGRPKATELCVGVMSLGQPVPESVLGQRSHLLSVRPWLVNNARALNACNTCSPVIRPTPTQQFSQRPRRRALLGRAPVLPTLTILHFAIALGLPVQPSLLCRPGRGAVAPDSFLSILGFRRMRKQ